MNNRERLELVEALFHRALGGGVESLVEDASLDESIRAEVNSLLASQRAWSADLAAAAMDPTEANGGAQRSFGPYRAERVLGSGGMGTVYLAARSDGQYQRQVAVKVLNASCAGPMFEQRFLAERQILAGLNHPFIARLFDGGVNENGEPYLVLEFVDGLPLNHFCDQRRLDARSRIGLFRNVCEAVDYAHRHLVVHSDLKPSNILVNLEGVVKLVDFGTSKLIQDENTAGLAALTPRYASPEQLRGERVSVATDVFSLGVVLYELLTGADPFGRGASVIAVLERAREERPPAPPAAAATPEAAGLQGIRLDQLRRTLSGDLASILGKALAHDPQARYDGVSSFSDDLERWLTGHPVQARPRSWTYRAGKFVRRNWLPAAASFAAVLGLAAFAGVAAYQAKLANDRYGDLRGMATSLLTEMREAIRDIPGSTQAQQIMATRVLKNLDKLAAASSDPAVQLDLAEAYLQLGELQGSPYSQNLGDPKAGLVTLDKGLQVLRLPLLAGQISSLPYLRLDGLLKRTAGEIRFGTGETAAAVTWLEKATASFDRLATLTREPALLAEASTTHGVLGDILGQRGMASTGDSDRAFREYSAAIDLNREILRVNPGFTRTRRGMGIILTKQSDLSLLTNPALAYEKIQAAAKEFMQLPESELQRPAMKRVLLTTDRKTGNVLVELLRFREAEPILKRVAQAHEDALANDPEDQRANFDLAVTLNDLGRLYIEAERTKEGAAVYERLVRILDTLCRKDPANRTYRVHYARQRIQLGRFLALLGGNPDRIVQLGRQAIQDAAKLAESGDANTLEFEALAEALVKVVPAFLRDPIRASAFAERAYSAGHPDQLERLTLLAEAKLQAGQVVEARQRAAQAVGLMAAGTKSALRRRLDSVLK